MLNKCINCGKIWGDFDDYFDVKSMHYSHGYCHDCFILLMKHKIRNKQINEGFSPCFVSKKECNETICLYYDICMDKK